MEHAIDLAAVKGPLTSIFPLVKNSDFSKVKTNEDQESSDQMPQSQDKEPLLEYDCSIQGRTIPLTSLQIDNRDELISKAQSIVNSELEKELRSALIKVAAEGHLPKVLASPCPVKAQVSDDIKLLEEPNSAWFNNVANSKVGSCLIVKDIANLMDEMINGLEEELPLMERNLTLLVPDTHMKYLTTSTDFCCSALETLKETYPELNIVSVRGLCTAAYAFAVLVYTSDVFGPAGYVVLDRDIKLTAAPRQIEIPKYRLVITHLSQMAVLEGI